MLLTKNEEKLYSSLEAGIKGKVVGSVVPKLEETTNNNKKYSAVVIHYDAIDQKWKTIDAEKP